MRDRSLEWLLKVFKKPPRIHPTHVASFNSAMVRAFFLFLEYDVYDPKWKNSLLEVLTVLGFKNNAEKMAEHAERRSRTSEDDRNLNNKKIKVANPYPHLSSIPRTPLDIHQVLALFKKLPIEKQVQLVLQNLGNIPPNFKPNVDQNLLIQFISLYSEPPNPPPSSSSSSSPISSNNHPLSNPPSNSSLLVNPSTSSNFPPSTNDPLDHTRDPRKLSSNPLHLSNTSGLSNPLSNNPINTLNPINTPNPKISVNPSQSENISESSETPYNPDAPYFPETPDLSNEKPKLIRNPSSSKFSDNSNQNKTKLERNATNPSNTNQIKKVSKKKQQNVDNFSLVFSKIKEKKRLELHKQIFDNILQEKDFIEKTRFGDHLRHVVVSKMLMGNSLDHPNSQLLLQYIKKDLFSSLKLSLCWLYQSYTFQNFNSLQNNVSFFF